MSPLAEQIESHLLSRSAWISAQELCLRFGIKERDLRGRDGDPGLCSAFAISGNLGYKHIAYADDAEEDRSYRRARRNGIGQLVMARKRRRAWRTYRTNPPAELERGTNQLLLLA